MCGTPLQTRDITRGPTSLSPRVVCGPAPAGCGPSPCEYPFVWPFPVRVGGDTNQASGHPAMQLRRRTPGNQE